MTEPGEPGEPGEQSPDRPAGVLGAGRMGLPIVGHLVRAGFGALVHDPGPDRRELVEARGGRYAATAAEVAAACSVILVCVGYEEQVDSLLTGPDGLLKQLTAGSVVAVLSTVAPDRVIELARAYRRQVSIRKALNRARSSGLMDAATGLFTRDLFAAHLARLTRSAQSRNRALSACVLRLTERPELKVLRAGGWVDKAVPQIGSMIGRLVRSEDTAARLGPETFALADLGDPDVEVHHEGRAVARLEGGAGDHRGDPVGGRAGGVAEGGGQGQGEDIITQLGGGVLDPDQPADH